LTIIVSQIVPKPWIVDRLPQSNFHRL
jgi:hypothetical protein